MWKERSQKQRLNLEKKEGGQGGPSKRQKKKKQSATQTKENQSTERHRAGTKISDKQSWGGARIGKGQEPVDPTGKEYRTERQN